jgi:UDP-N-acetylmuramoyl-L-alanyl-D-glutamate--2,6-diaminopimelate ligase
VSAPLGHLLEAVHARAAPAVANDTRIEGVTIDSRRVAAGWLFVACRGATPASADGHTFLRQAVERGAAAVVVEDREAADGLEGVGVYVVADSRLAAARLAERFAGEPSSALTVIGLTGTNGKTTVSFLVADLLTAAGLDAAVLGTLGVGRRAALRSMGFTTPEAEVLSAELARLRADGVTHLAMEVSSIALATERVGALSLQVGAFTSFSQDHLDFHGNMESYFAAKVRMFSERVREGGRCVLPDAGGEYEARLREAVGEGALLWGRSEAADVRALEERVGAAGIDLRLRIAGVEGEVHSPLLGAYNVDNLLCAAACALAAGLSGAQVLAALPAAAAVPGRFEAVPGSGQRTPLVVVDYAHTPDALQRALSACRALAAGRVIVVFGCGGDRDAAKRPLMGRAAADGADVVVVTDDNPRSEPPAAIVDEIAGGLDADAEVDATALRDGGWARVPGRRAAIEAALTHARVGDVVLIAGKGHERTQTIGEQVLPFSDVEVASAVLRGGTS